MIDYILNLVELAFRHDTISLYFLMFGGGILTSFTPCIYPVLPLIIGYIGNQASDNRKKAIYLSLSLVSGLSFVYALFGISIAAVGGTYGSIMGNGWLMYSIAIFFLLMSLFMLDALYIPNPEFFSRLQAKSANLKGLFGAFIVGGVSGLVVGPCTGPILAVALGAIAISLEESHGVDYVLHLLKSGTQLFLFGFGQGTIIILAGIMTGFISKLPKAGVWMEVIKKGFAFIIIISASLFLVFVGQNTDFPNLTQFFAKAEFNVLSDSEIKNSTEQTTAAPETNKEKPLQNTDLISLEKPAPDFTLDSLSGEKVALSHLKGKKGVVVVFFATWCTHCMKEVPEIKQFAEMAQKQNIVVLGINYGQPMEVVQRFKKTQEINYTILLDTGGTVSTETYGVKGLPYIVGVNGKGNVIYTGLSIPDNKAEFVNNLKEGL